MVRKPLLLCWIDWRESLALSINCPVVEECLNMIRFQTKPLEKAFIQGCLIEFYEIWDINTDKHTKSVPCDQFLMSFGYLRRYFPEARSVFLGRWLGGILGGVLVYLMGGGWINILERFLQPNYSKLLLHKSDYLVSLNNLGFFWYLELFNNNLNIY